MKETSKATARREKENASGILPWGDWLKGKVIDIGPGDDLLPLKDCVAFDEAQGDANDLTQYFKPNTFDALHSSNCLEHLHDAEASLGTWFSVVKKGGYVVFTVPEAILYGDMLWELGPRYNPDHKATFSVFLEGSPAPKHYFMPNWIGNICRKFKAECKLLRLVDTNYDYGVMFVRDQTYSFEAGVECFCECVLMKL
jgi:SAM-dependent methyltransferase